MNRPVKYLSSSKIRKETVAHKIAQKDDIQEGLICLITCVEPCRSYEIVRNRASKKLVLTGVGIEGESRDYSYLTNCAAEFDQAITDLLNHISSHQITMREYLNSF